MARSRRSVPPAPPAPAAPPEAFFTPAEAAAIERALARRGRTPAAVLDAFLAPAITMGDVALAPLSIGTFLLLERIDSPLVDTEGEPEVSASDAMAAAFICSRPWDRTESLLAEGRPAFDRAVLAWAAQIPAEHLTALTLALGQAIRAATATVTGAKKKPMTPPVAAAPSPAAATTASAGA